jgi:sugar lactone lactonase YvrE
VHLLRGKVTACAFGGNELDELFITTSRLMLPEGADPQGGALFRYVGGVRGQPVIEFAG